MAPMVMEEELMMLLPALFSGVPSVLMNLASWILTALALYTIARRRGLNNPWLAWVPGINCWILGSLSDQYQYVVKGQNKSKRKLLLILGILSMVFTIAVVVLCITLIGTAIFSGGQTAPDMTSIMGPLMAILGLCLPLAAVSIAYAVIRFMALFDVYRSLDPSNAVLFLVLSILFGITIPFFLFFNRQKDGGMPPRKQAPVQEYVYEETTQWQPAQPEQEPWEEESKDYL